MTPEEFRAFGHQLIDWITDYRAGLAERPVMARISPGEVKAQLPACPPEHPESFAAVFRDLERIIVPGLSHWQHPNFFGYFPANASLASILGDYLSTGLGVLGLSWQASPAVTELEEVVTDWVRQMLGLSEAWSGVIQDTASTSTLVALLCARERATDYGLGRGGLQAEERPLVVYTSGQSHSSVEKAALLAGFGRDNVRRVAHDSAYAMLSKALAADVRRDLAEGKMPCAVVATTGTTTSTAFDPVGTVAQVAREHDLWLHVDAAMAGSAMILPECRWMWEGIEGADSLVLNAHKWLGARLRLLALLHPGPRAPRPGDVYQPELPAILGGWPGQESARLGHPPWSPVPRPEALVPAPGRRGQRPPSPPSPGPRQRPVARRRGAISPELAGAGPGTAANRLRSARAAGVGG